MASSSSSSTLKCKRGEIVRSRYTRKLKSGKKIVVKESCIKDLGKKGKGEKLFTLKKGGLSKYGYSLKKSASQRRQSLKRSNKEFSKGTLIRKLNALSILQKNTNPVISRKAKHDMNWVRNNID